MTVYINCLVSDYEKEYMLLLTKTKGPSFLIGKDNFPGGRLEAGEDPKNAAIREVYEETGVRINPKDIALLQKTEDTQSSLYTFYAQVTRQELAQARTLEEEPVRVESIALMQAHWALCPQSAAPDLPKLTQQVVSAMGYDKKSCLEQSGPIAQIHNL